MTVQTEMMPRICSSQRDDSNWWEKKKKGKAEKKEGTRQKLKTLRGGRMPLPRVILSNARSLSAKLDELEANVWYKQEYREVCLLAFTHTWLDHCIHDHELTTTVPVDLQTDRENSRMVVCVSMSTESGVILLLSVKHLACLTLSCCQSHFPPFCFSREFPQLFIMLVDIHPGTNASRAADHISNSQTGFTISGCS